MVYSTEIKVVFGAIGRYLAEKLLVGGENHVNSIVDPFFPDYFFLIWAQKIFIDLVIFNAVYFLGLTAISYFVLPVQGLKDVFHTTVRLFLYTFGLIGPVVFIRNGKIIAAPNELNKNSIFGFGLALIDYNSAIAILDKPINNYLLKRLFKPRENPVRIEGQGVAFISINEVISPEVIDLRKQIRVDGRVDAQTRDGIKITAPIFAIFTLGQPPETVYVTTQKNPQFPNKTDCFFIEQNNGKISKLTKIEDKNLLLDIETKLAKFEVDARDYVETQQKKKQHSINLLDKERIREAIFASGRNLGDGGIIPWSEIPVNYATNLFRTEISKYKFDYLLTPESADKFPLINIKKKFAQNIRMAGLWIFKLFGEKIDRLSKKTIFGIPQIFLFRLSIHLLGLTRFVMLVLRSYMQHLGLFVQQRMKFLKALNKYGLPRKINKLCNLKLDLD